MDRVRGSVIITTWNARDVLGRCLDSVEGQRFTGGLETIVVDNGSADGTLDLLRERASDLRLIENHHNAGFSEASNRGAAAARGEVLFFLNPDTELLRDDVLERLALAAGDPAVGIAGPMLVNPDGSLQPSCAPHPSVGHALLVGAGLHRLLPDRARARIAPQFWSHDRAIYTGWLMGAALALRAEVFRELGGFWRTMYGEDAELAYRARQRGLRVRFERSAKVMHLGNHAGAQRWSSAERAERIAATELQFLRVHYARPRAAAIRLIVGTAYAARWLVHSLLRRGERAAVYRAMTRVYAGAR